MSINRQMGKEDVVHIHRKEYYSAIKPMKGFPRGSEVKNAPAMQGPWVRSLG